MLRRITSNSRLGVGTDNTLYSYDLLQNQALAQGSGAMSLKRSRTEWSR